MFAPAVFLDKDGTLVANVPYNVDVTKIVLAIGADADQEGDGVPRERRGGHGTGPSRM